MDITSLMWDETGRDYDYERSELARTAALADVDRLVGEFVYRAGDDVDLLHRLALAEPQLQAVANMRSYSVEELTGDIKQRWQLLSTARTASAQQTAAARQVTAAQEMAMDAVAARLAAVAARENPDVPAVMRPWAFATDGGWSAGVHGIPTVGFAPGEERFAHTNRERLDLEEARWAMGRYPDLILALQETLARSR